LQNPSSFFHLESKPNREESSKTERRFYSKRYSRLYSEGLVRGLERTCDALCIDEQIQPQAIPPAYDTSLGTAAAKWGQMKLGEILIY